MDARTAEIIAEEPAFPRQSNRHGTPGMTMRQYYKAAALQGILARDDISAKSAIEGAAIYADAMLAEDARNQEQA